MSVYIYTDGSCRGNGGKDPLAGIGIYFGEDDPRNVSKRLDGKKQTNNVAELTAVIETFELIKADMVKGKKYVIVTDSEYVIKCMTSYGKRCALGGWIKDIPNRELVRKAYQAYAPFKNITFMHVMAHTNQDTPHARGNAEADRLANEGALAGRVMAESDSIRFDLEDELVGAKWDPSSKGWYISVQNPFESKSESTTSNRVDLKVSYTEKDEAKRMGARWDPSAKVWYTVATNTNLIKRFPT
tara:strand:- start:1980 stop:2708 length:729 start_codon:yes stop_codon:yes gene_type:complete